MRLILDANTLIYLVKAGISDKFYNLLDKQLVIDKEVYNETVNRGIENNYPDAYIIKKFIEKRQIPIIPVDISSDLSKFRDAGETSCFILAKSEGLCISSDIRASKKFDLFNISNIQVDTFFYNKYLKGKLTKKDFITILEKLKKVNGTSPNRISLFLELLFKKGENNE